jgi:hypothetical protein
VRAQSLALIALFVACDEAHDRVLAPPGRVGDQAREDAALAAALSIDAGVSIDAGLARCIPMPQAELRFESSSLLPWAGNRAAQILTGNVRARETARGRELYVSEPLLSEVVLLRGCAPHCSTALLLEDLVAPVRAQPVDFDDDGDEDVLVADIGTVQARPSLVGRVVLLRLEDDGHYESHVLLDGVGRVACAEAADLDGDGDRDIAVCEFGAEDGSLLWLEQTARGTLERHELWRGAGAIHAFPDDIDHDGDADLVVALSQSTQRVVLFRNAGKAAFAPETIFQAPSEGFGLSGIELDDLDGDGDRDVLVSGGDYLDDSYDLAAQGVWWLENDGHGQFAPHQILVAAGAYATSSIDVDRDCDRDIVLARVLMPDRLIGEDLPDSGLSWLENDGRQHFVPHLIPGAPLQLASVAALRDAHGLAIFTGSFTISAAATQDRRLLMFSAP